MTHGVMSVFFLFLMVLAPADSEEQVPETERVFSGRIVDAVSGRGVEGARIQLSELGLGSITNADGEFVIYGVPGVFLDAAAMVTHPCFHAVAIQFDNYHVQDPFELGLPFRLPRTLDGHEVPGRCSDYGPQR